MMSGRVVVYTKTTCPHCVKAKALLATKTHILPIHVIDVTLHPERRADLVSRGLTTVPQIFINDTLIEGGNAGLQGLEAEGKLDGLLSAGAVSSPPPSAPVPLPAPEGLLQAASATSAAPATSASTPSFEASSTSDDGGDGDDDDDESEFEEDDEAELTELVGHPTSSSCLYILHDNAAWLTPYRAALVAAGVPFVEWDMGSGRVDLTKTPPHGVFFNRASVSSHTRGSRYAVEHAQAVVSWLEAHGRTVVGGSGALALEMSKVKQVVDLAAAGVKSPHTDAVVGKRHLLSAIRRRLSHAKHGVIVKPNRGGSGAGVRLVRSMKEAKAYAKAGDFNGSLDGTLIVQDFVPSPEAALYRLEFVNGKNIYALRVDTSHIVPPAGQDAAPAASLSNCPLGEEEHEEEAPAAPAQMSNCPADSCNLDDDPATSKFRVVTDFEHAIIPRLEAFLTKAAIGVAGIEIVLDTEGEAWVIDANVVNSNMNRAAEIRAGLPRSGVEQVVDFLASLLPSAGSSSSPYSSSPCKCAQLTKAAEVDDGLATASLAGSVSVASLASLEPVPVA